MNDSSAEYLEWLIHVTEQPQMYGSPQYAEGIAIVLAAVLYQKRKTSSVVAAFRRIYDLKPEACKEIERPSERGVCLCDEKLYPEHRISYEALTRHGKIFIDLLKSLD